MYLTQIGSGVKHGLLYYTVGRNVLFKRPSVYVGLAAAIVAIDIDGNKIQLYCKLDVTPDGKVTEAETKLFEKLGKRILYEQMAGDIIVTDIELVTLW